MDVKSKIAPKNLVLGSFLSLATSEHSEIITNHFNGNTSLSDANYSFKNTAFIFILFTNRSGSNLLSRLVSNTFNIKQLGESLNYISVVRSAKKNNFSAFHQYLDDLVGNDNESVILKASIGQLVFLYSLGFFKALKKKPAFIITTREDIVSQAVSFSIATQTHKWESNQKGNGVVPKYNEKKIVNSMHNIVKQNSLTGMFVKLFDLEHINVEYEEMIQNTDSIITTIGEKFGLEKVKNAIVDINKLKLKKQGNEINEQFISKFRNSLAKY